MRIIETFKVQVAYLKGLLDKGTKKKLPTSSFEEFKRNSKIRFLIIINPNLILSDTIAKSRESDSRKKRVGVKMTERLHILIEFA